MEEKQKSSVGLVVLVVILLLACVGMGAFIFVNKYKLISKESTQTTNKEEEKETETAEKTETTKENEKETAEKTETTKANEKAIETRECTGVYSGTAAIT